jgi:assimilatory nitrate reductase catalytic subunit
MKKLDLLVISENVLSNDSVNSGAHVLLPALAWGEKSGTVTNSERRISRQRTFLPAPGEARPDWWIVSEVAKRLGHGQAFAYTSAADIFREHASLSEFENSGSRDFDISAHTDVSDIDFDAMEPFMWPARRNEGSAQVRFFSDGGFFSFDRKGHFIAPETPMLRGTTSAAYPLRLNTGRIRDQWHTMTRTGSSPRLGQHLPEPFVEIHPDDASQANIVDGGFARVVTGLGQCVLKAVVTERQQRGMLFAPIHWSDETSSFARVGSLVAPVTDPFSGQPENKATPAAIEPVLFAQRGFVLSHQPLTFPNHVWWARVAVPEGVGYLLAANGSMENWRSWFSGSGEDAEVAEYADAGRGVYRAARFDDGALESCLFIGPADIALDWDAIKPLLAVGSLSDEQRRLVLSGKSADGVGGGGPIVCACFGVGRTTICNTIASGQTTVAGLGAELRAGTNCGSCIPELKRLIAQHAPQQAADCPLARETAAAS